MVTQQIAGFKNYDNTSRFLEADDIERKCGSRNKQLMIKIFLALWLGLIFSGISYIFWHNEWKYSLPTPVPESYKEVKVGSYINIAGKLKTEENKPVFIHFFK